MFIVSAAVEMVPSGTQLTDPYESADLPGVAIQVLKADGGKCERCWNWSTKVGSFDDHAPPSANAVMRL